MNNKKVKKSIKKAKKYIEAAEACIAKNREYQEEYARKEAQGVMYNFMHNIYASGSKETANLRRKSMELTRSLIDLRKAN